MKTIKLLGGDFGNGSLFYIKTGWDQQPALTVDGEPKLVRNLIERVEIQTQEQAQRTYSVLTGIAGAALLGPLGALLGAGTKQGQICFAAYLRDGRKFLALSEPITFQEIQGAVFSGPDPNAKIDMFLGPKVLLWMMGIGIPLIAIVKGC
jgi:hypothetical protein